MTLERICGTALVFVVSITASLFVNACSRCSSRVNLAEQGGLRLVYEVQVQHAFDSSVQGEERQERIAAAMKQARQTTVRRLESVEQPYRIEVQGTKLVVELFGAGKVPHVLALLAREGRLEFNITDDHERDFYEKLRPLTTNDPGVAIMDERSTFYLSAVDSRGDDMVERTGEELLRHFVERAKKLGIVAPPGRELAFEKNAPRSGEKGYAWRSYLLHSEPVFTGDFVNDATVEYARDGYDAGTPYVNLEFDDRGREIFARVTSENVGKRLAIVLDGQVNSAPVIQEAITGGRARISLGGTTYQNREDLLREAHDLVIVLREGALPAPLVLLEETVIGPARGSGPE